MGRTRVTVVGCVMLLVAFAMGALQSPSLRLTTADVNGDGRPDVWQYSDEHGQTVRVIRDTNYDGRSDIEESYVNGRLFRRESDRNFDDRIDLREDFNSTTGEHVRSVVDADFDGTADLLVLFADGRPVYSQWTNSASANARPATAAAATRRESGDSLGSLDDPFASNGRFEARDDRPERIAVGGTLSTTCARWPARSAVPHTRSVSVPVLKPSFVKASLSPTTLRGPPASGTLL